MLNILVVDDEYMIRTGIRTVINRTDTDWNVVAEASNGLEALEIIEATPVDLVITDIKMPDMDGLQLMEEIVLRGYECSIIIITAYSDFEFAKKAIKYGAIDYLLKPVDPDSLFQIIGKADNILKERQKRQFDQLRLKEDESLLRGMILSQLHLGYYKDVDKVQSELKRLGYNIHEYTVLIYGYFLCETSSLFFHVKENLLSGLDNAEYKIHELLAEENSVVFLIWNEKHSVVLDDIIHMIEKVSSNQVNNELHFGLSGVHSDLGSVALAFNQGLSSYNMAAENRKKLISYGDINKNQPVVQYPYDIEYKLIFAVKCGNEEEVVKLSKELADRLFYKNTDSSLYDLVMITSKSVSALKRLMMEANENAALLIKNEMDVNSSFGKFLDRNELKCWFLDEVNRITGFIMKNRKFKCRKIIEQVKEIAYKHFNEDISIKDIADEVYMNASYLSELFKQNTGVTFTEFLMDYRLQKAKELLKDPNRKIYEVAEQVGYKNTRYFSQIFKKVVGVLPVEYREI